MKKTSTDAGAIHVPTQDDRVDAFLDRADRWQKEMSALRTIALDVGLEECLKWGKPCYTVDGGNVAIIQPFKGRVSLMFFKGALLDDPEGLLERPGPDSHAARRMNFSDMEGLSAAKGAARRFLAQAMQAQQEGKTVPERKELTPIPAELQEAFQETARLQAAFESLTPGRQRGYILHFSGAKQSKTRRSRIDKCTPRILDGLGLHD